MKKMMKRAKYQNSNHESMMKQNIEESDVCIELRYTLFQTFEEKLAQRVTDIDCSLSKCFFEKQLFRWFRTFYLETK